MLSAWKDPNTDFMYILLASVEHKYQSYQQQKEKRAQKQVQITSVHSKSSKYNI